MATLRYVSIVVAALIGVAALAVFGWFSSCQGRMQECYASFRGAADNTDLIMRERQRAIYAGFAASHSTVAFPMPLTDGRLGIVMINRSTGLPSLVAPAGYTHWSPNFSRNGERLLLLRQIKGNSETELVSCKTEAWQCDVLYKTDSVISSVADIDDGTVIVSMSIRQSGDHERRRRFDLYVIRRGQHPERLTEYEAYTMSSLSVAADKIAFAAEGGVGLEPPRCGKTDRSKCDESNIYVLDLVRSKLAVANRPSTLRPTLVASGYTVAVALSGDGTRVALRNTARRGNPWRYNVIIAGLDGAVDRQIDVEGYAFSSGVFVGETFLVNELFDDRYRVRALNLSTRQRHDLQFDFSATTSAEPMPITLSFS